MYITNSTYKNCIEKIRVKDFESFKNKSFFITGASGLIGSFLIDTLAYLNENYDYNIKIYATFSSESSLENRFPSYFQDDLFFPIIHNITKSFDEVYDCIDNIDYIVHAASNTHPMLYAKEPVNTIELNIQGTLNTLRLASKYPNSKTIFLSTLEVYGEDKTVESFKENNIGFIDFNTTRACYPESKRLCETICHSFIQEFNIDIVIARLGYIFGPTVKSNSSKADVQFLNNALRNEDIVLKSAGLQQRSYCFVGDVVSALLTLLLKGQTGEAYNIASEFGNVRLRDFAQTLANTAKVGITFAEETEVEKRGGSKVMNSTLDTTKLSSLGWKSNFTLEEGIEATFNIKKDLL